MAKKNARNTRGKIVSAAWKLFYEQGYEDTTVEEIIVSMGRTPFFPPLAPCLMKNMRS